MHPDRHEGMDRVLRRERVAWKNKVAKIIWSLSRSRDVIDARDVKAVAEKMQVGAPHHPNCWGAAFNASAQRGEIVKVGAVMHPEHGGLIAQWSRSDKEPANGREPKARARSAARRTSGELVEELVRVANEIYEMTMRDPTVKFVVPDGEQGKKIIRMARMFGIVSEEQGVN